MRDTSAVFRVVARIASAAAKTQQPPGARSAIPATGLATGLSAVVVPHHPGIERPVPVARRENERGICETDRRTFRAFEL